MALFVATRGAVFLGRHLLDFHITKHTLVNSRKTDIIEIGKM